MTLGVYLWACVALFAIDTCRSALNFYTSTLHESTKEKWFYVFSLAAHAAFLAIAIAFAVEGS